MGETPRRYRAQGRPQIFKSEAATRDPGCGSNDSGWSHLLPNDWLPPSKGLGLLCPAAGRQSPRSGSDLWGKVEPPFPVVETREAQQLGVILEELSDRKSMRGCSVTLSPRYYSFFPPHLLEGCVPFFAAMSASTDGLRDFQGPPMAVFPSAPTPFGSCPLHTVGSLEI